jgi:hypothetical protein
VSVGEAPAVADAIEPGHRSRAAPPRNAPLAATGDTGVTAGGRADGRRASVLAGSLRRVVPFAVSAACLGLLAALFQDRLPAVVGALRGADPVALAVASIVYLLVFYVLAVRMRVVLRALGVDQRPPACSSAR